MKTNPTKTETYIADWKKLLKRMKMDEIKRKSPGFFAVSGGYESSLAPTYRDTNDKELTKSISHFLTCTGFKVEVLNQARVKIREIPRYNIFSEKLQSIGKRAEVIAPAEEGGAEIVATSNQHKIRLKVSTSHQRRDDSIEQPKEVADYIAADFPRFLAWFAERFPILFATCPRV